MSTAKRLTTLKPRVTTIEISRVQKTGAANPPARLYGSRWNRERLRHLRASPLCVYCKQSDLIELATVVDHITPHKGNVHLFWDQKNWQSLCKLCHDGRKAKEEHADGYRL